MFYSFGQVVREISLCATVFEIFVNKRKNSPFTPDKDLFSKVYVIWSFTHFITFTFSNENINSIIRERANNCKTM